MTIRLTPQAFVQLLRAAKEIDREFLWFPQTIWLLEHWTGSVDESIELSLSPSVDSILEPRPTSFARFVKGGFAFGYDSLETELFQHPDKFCWCGVHRL